MQLVFQDREEARSRGRAARREIEANYSEEKVADLVRQRLEVIASRHRFPAFKREIRAFFSGYQQLVRRIREVVRTALPADATVIVVSKGDDELLSWMADGPGTSPRQRVACTRAITRPTAPGPSPTWRSCGPEGASSCFFLVRLFGGWTTTRISVSISTPAIGPSGMTRAASFTGCLRLR